VKELHSSAILERRWDEKDLISAGKKKKKAPTHVGDNRCRHNLYHNNAEGGKKKRNGRTVEPRTATAYGENYAACKPVRCLAAVGTMLWRKYSRNKERQILMGKYFPIHTPLHLKEWYERRRKIFSHKQAIWRWSLIEQAWRSMWQSHVYRKRRRRSNLGAWKNEEANKRERQYRQAWRIWNDSPTGFVRSACWTRQASSGVYTTKKKVDDEMICKQEGELLQSYNFAWRK